MTIDWLVLLAPLLVLPILLLFPFVGCVLDQTGKATSLSFTFEPGLSNAADVDHIDVTLAGGSSFDSATLVLSGADLVNGGARQITLPGVTLESEGTVTCSCVVTKNAPGAPGNPSPLSKSKIEDEKAPPFTLSRDGTGFHLS